MARDTFHPATVRHINKDHITISPGDGYSVTVFAISTGHVEAIVVSDDGLDTHRLLIEAPSSGREMIIKRHEPTGIVDIVYHARPDVQV